MNILEQIIATKKKEVALQKELVKLETLLLQPLYAKTPLNFASNLVDETKTGIIAEFKRKSPSKGIINDKIAPQEMVEGYFNGGASAVSVLTDVQYFGGNNDDLIAVQHIPIPKLRKEFIIDEYQIHEAKALGASCILLIAACLTPKQVKQLAQIAQSIQLQVLLEIHDETELNHLNDSINFVGVNNRNLKTFEVSLQTSIKLIQKIPAEFLAIAESGIHSVEDILLLKQAGFKGFLIGEYFMKQPNPTVAFAQFTQLLKTKENES